MTALVAIVVVVAVIAAVRRLVRTAATLGMLAVAGAAGPSVADTVQGIVGDGVNVLSAEQASTAHKPRAVDGDTIKVRENGTQVTVRVALVDAGESSSTRYGRPTCGGTNAKRFAQAWVAHRQTVQVKRVGGLPRADRYSRRLARLIDDQGQDYGMTLVRHGWARVTVYEQPHGAGATYLKRLQTAESTARRSKRGAWSTCNWQTHTGVK